MYIKKIIYIITPLTNKKIEFTDEAIDEIICGYTMEAGVRNLERELATIARKSTTNILM